MKRGLALAQPSLIMCANQAVERRRHAKKVFAQAAAVGKVRTKAAFAALRAREEAEMRERLQRNIAKAKQREAKQAARLKAEQQAEVRETAHYVRTPMTCSACRRNADVLCAKRKPRPYKSA